MASFSIAPHIVITLLIIAPIDKEGYSFSYCATLVGRAITLERAVHKRI